MIRVEIHESLQNVVAAGVIELSSMTYKNDYEQLWNELNDTCEEIRFYCKEMTVGQIPGVQDTRRLYRTIGLDPTKTRPSSEALLRRIIKGKSLYRIHPLVDLFNSISITSKLSVGLYDQSKIVGQTVTIRIGKEGWGFDGIRKDRINVGGRLCVVDEKGPFGSPTADSRRTSIEGDVDRALAIFFTAIDGDMNRLNGSLDMASDSSRRHFGAVIENRYLVGKNETPTVIGYSQY